MKKIFYIEERYPEKRCVISKLDDYFYCDIRAGHSLNVILDNFRQKIRHRVSAMKGEKTLSIYQYSKKSGIIHSFNSCIKSKTNWICNFETIIPRTNCTRSSDWGQIDGVTLEALKLIAKDNCLQCFALSDATKKIEMNFLDSLGTVLDHTQIQKIRNKISVLHPPQEVFLNRNEIEKKFSDGRQKELIFVGHDFFRKGGKEIIDVLTELKKEYNFHLTVVSKMEYDDYASKATKEEQCEYLEKIKNSEWISYFSELPNEEVMNLCKMSHVGLLPTFADTYGYSVLEMQASAVVMVTTDIRALPEINNNDCGYICHLNHNEFGEAFYHSENDRVNMKMQLRESLETVLKEVLSEDMEKLKKKALLSVERIEKYHNPKRYAETIRKVIE